MSIPLPRRTAFGLGFSLLAHAAVLAWLVHMAPKVPPDEAPVTSMQVTLLRLPPPRTEALPAPVPRAQPLQSSRARAASPAARPKRAAPAAEPPSVIMLAPKDETVAVESAPKQGAAVSFDPQAARGAARAWVKGEGAGMGGADGRGRPMGASRDEKLGEAIERAKPADCRNAYAGLGVLAVIPLAASAVTGKGCKW